MIIKIDKHINGGKVITKDDLCESPNSNSRSIRKFLNNLFLDFVRKSYSFYSNTDDLPFIYSEKQLHSILCPSLYNNSDSLFMEQPINRSKKKDKNSSHKKRRYGWTDYFVVKKERAYIIEVKHSWQAIGKNITKITDNRWVKAKDQLRIPYGQLREIYPKSKTYVALSIMVLPVYSSRSKENSCCQLKSDEAVILCDNIIKQLRPKPNWVGIWMFNRGLKEPFAYKDEYQSYSSLMFLVHCRLIK